MSSWPAPTLNLGSVSDCGSFSIVSPKEFRENARGCSCQAASPPLVLCAGLECQVSQENAPVLGRRRHRSLDAHPAAGADQGTAQPACCHSVATPHQLSPSPRVRGSSVCHSSGLCTLPVWDIRLLHLVPGVWRAAMPLCQLPPQVCPPLPATASVVPLLPQSQV